MPHPDVILELPTVWFENVEDGDRHRRFYVSIWQALGDLGVTVRPIPLRFGADAAPRLSYHDQLVVSFHSRGPIGNVLRMKESYVPPYYTADRAGYSGFSELALYPERFKGEVEATPTAAAIDFVDALKRDIVAANLSKYPQRHDGVEILPERYVFLPLQTVDDPVAELCELEQIAVLETLLQATAALGWGMVVKRHPRCRSLRVASSLERLAAQHPHLKRSDASVHRLVSSAEAVVGANSGVLFEALLHGAHVVSFAKSDFRVVTTPISHHADLPSAILGRGRVSRDRQCRFLYWYLRNHCLRADDVSAIRGRFAAALSRLDRAPDPHHQAQIDLFDRFAREEAQRRRTFFAEG